MARETIQTLLGKSIPFLQERGVDEARRSAELLLAHALGSRRIDLYMRFEQPLSDEEIERYRAAIRRRIAGEPVQYIMGSTEFYALPFRVTPDVLIPRPETEHLVEAAIDVLRADAPAGADGLHPRVLDIGTGSGCIAVALAHHVSGARITAIDASDRALAVARGNAELNRVTGRISFVCADVLSDAGIPGGESFDLVVSNPPYITAEEYPTLQSEVRDHEPRMALTDGGDGLAFHRRIASLLSRILVPGGTCLLEIGFGQSAGIDVIAAQCGMPAPTFINDYAGIPRVAVLRR